MDTDGGDDAGANGDDAGANGGDGDTGANADAGVDTGANADGDPKAALRQRVWDELEESGAARFPYPPHGRIPNFAGADRAADRLADTDAWAGATTVKANPDAPQLPVRRAALRAGKTVYVAVPRLRDREAFLELDPADLAPGEYDDATTVSGIGEYGTPRAPSAMAPVDLIVSGSVAVSPEGARVGKGEGYSDLEYAVLREAGVVDGDTVTATTVHGRQLREDGTVPAPAAHDVPMDLVATPDRVVRTDTPHGRPEGLLPDRLDGDRIGEIPLLAARRPGDGTEE